LRRLPAVLIAACVAAAALAVPATAGDTDVVSPPKIFATKLAKVKSNSGIDVYLPSHLRVFTTARRARGTATSDSGTYDLELGIGRRCNGANACYLANFTGTKGVEPGFGRRARLTGGHTGYWKGITCGASCSPAEIQWVEDDVLYSIATKGVSLKKEKATLVKLANSAITAGPR
jgi:hypothetical protein